MPGGGDMSALCAPADVVYSYDGSLMGLYSAIHACVYNRELPVDIVAEDAAQPTFFMQRCIEAERAKATRVRASVNDRISPRAVELVENVFLSCMEQKELATLRFLLLGYAHGRATVNMLGHADVAPMLKAEQHLLGECHLLKGFIRFTDYGGLLAATITPKNFALPYLRAHFAARYNAERFMIYDKTHKAALLYERGSSRIVPLEGIEFAEPDADEQKYRDLWKRFYDTIAIESRRNPVCRRTHMPKRYWENMPEMHDQR